MRRAAILLIHLLPHRAGLFYRDDLSILRQHNLVTRCNNSIIRIVELQHFIRRPTARISRTYHYWAMSHYDVPSRAKSISGWLVNYRHYRHSGSEEPFYTYDSALEHAAHTPSLNSFTLVDYDFMSL
jgi:hypothetical protein